MVLKNINFSEQGNEKPFIKKKNREMRNHYYHYCCFKMRNNYNNYCVENYYFSSSVLFLVIIRTSYKFPATTSLVLHKFWAFQPKSPPKPSHSRPTLSEAEEKSTTQKNMAKEAKDSQKSCSYSSVKAPKMPSNE